MGDATNALAVVKDAHGPCAKRGRCEFDFDMASNQRNVQALTDLSKRRPTSLQKTTQLRFRGGAFTAFKCGKIRGDVGPSPYTGVHELHLTPSPNTFGEFEEFLTNPANRRPSDGALMVSGLAFHGYNNYDTLPVEHNVKMQRACTVLANRKDVWFFVTNIPPLWRIFVELMRHMGVDNNDWKDVLAQVHVLGQDWTNQAAFAWHVDCEKVVRDEQLASNTITAVVQCSGDRTCMRVLGFQPVVLTRAGHTSVFWADTVHQSVPWTQSAHHECHAGWLGRRVFKVAFFLEPRSPKDPLALLSLPGSAGRTVTYAQFHPARMLAGQLPVGPNTAASAAYETLIHCRSFVLHRGILERADRTEASPMPMEIIHAHGDLWMERPEFVKKSALHSLWRALYLCAPFGKHGAPSFYVMMRDPPEVIGIVWYEAITADTCNMLSIAAYKGNGSQLLASFEQDRADNGVKVLMAPMDVCKLKAGKWLQDRHWKLTAVTKRQAPTASDGEILTRTLHAVTLPVSTDCAMTLPASFVRVTRQPGEKERCHASPYVQPVYGRAMVNLEKTVEGRPNSGFAALVRPGDSISFKVSGLLPALPMVKVRVTEVLKFSSFRDMLVYFEDAPTRTGGVASLLPKSTGFEGTADDAVSVYHRIRDRHGNLYEDLAVLNGALAIRFEFKELAGNVTRREWERIISSY